LSCDESEIVVDEPLLRYIKDHEALFASHALTAEAKNWVTELNVKDEQGKKPNIKQLWEAINGKTATYLENVINDIVSRAYSASRSREQLVQLLMSYQPAGNRAARTLESINAQLERLLSGDGQGANVYQFGVSLDSELKKKILEIEGLNAYLKGNAGEYMVRIVGGDDSEGGHKDIMKSVVVNVFGEARLIHHNEVCENMDVYKVCRDANTEKDIVRAGMYNFYISNRLVLYKVYEGVSLKRAQAETIEGEKVNVVRGKLDFDYAYFGDLDGDGKINIQDVLLLPDFFNNHLEDLDVNMDGTVNLDDLYKLPYNEKLTTGGKYQGDMRKNNP